jgi:hypothetical protein
MFLTFFTTIFLIYAFATAKEEHNFWFYYARIGLSIFFLSLLMVLHNYYEVLKHEREENQPLLIDFDDNRGQYQSL